MKAKREGRTARICDHVELADCPYPNDSIKRKAWRDAWRKADKEMCALGWSMTQERAWQAKQQEVV